MPRHEGYQRQANQEQGQQIGAKGLPKGMVDLPTAILLSVRGTEAVPAA